jgi:uncharacterized protein (TIGR04255 family)
MICPIGEVAVSPHKKDAAEKEGSVLTLPKVSRAQFKTNFIRTVVCELRFPAILDYETKPPITLQRELRKEYPEYEKQQAFNVADPNERELKHVLKSRKGDWLVSIRTYSIALQTSRYTHFSEFLDRLQYLFDKSLPVLDTDFFTRVGLRYINEIRLDAGGPPGWVNDDLIAPIVHGIYGSTDRYVQEVRGSMESGKFTFRHGASSLQKSKEDTYTIDFDFYNENVQAGDVMPMVTEFNKEAFRFFQWAIGPKAKEILGQPIAIEGQ